VVDTIDLGPIGRDAGDEDVAHLAIVEVVDAAGVADRYLSSFITGSGAGPAREAHPGDGVWRALAVAVAQGRVVGTEGGGALVCRPGLGLSAFAPGGGAEIAGWEERPLGADRSNTSSVLGDRLLLKAYRHVVEGLNPELELIAYLAEERGLHGVPALGGSAEYIGPDGTVATVAVLEELVPDAEDAYETTVEALAEWIGAPGVVALEFATEDAAALGTALAELHATLAGADELDDFAPRDAETADLADWRRTGDAALAAALSALGEDGPQRAELEAWAPKIRDRLAGLEHPDGLPRLTRIHGDLRLGRILRTPGGFVFVGFEGDPMRPVSDRRRLASPLQDVAGLLLSLDHASTAAERRAMAAGWTPGEHAGLDTAAWRHRSRQRMLTAWASAIRRAGVGVDLDEGLLAGLAVARECAEYVHAATDLPGRLWAPQAGMRRLIEGEGTP